MNQLIRSTDSLAASLRNKRLYHATPLHYLPSILAHRQLLCAERGQKLGITPRKTASRRDKMLGVQKYVHFYFDLLNPLLSDKLNKGMPHCVLEFNAGQIYTDNVDRCALMPFNTKVWRSRADAIPVENRDQMANMLSARDRFGRYPSMEFLVEGSVRVEKILPITVFCERDFEIAEQVSKIFGVVTKPYVNLRIVNEYSASTGCSKTQHYLNLCVSTMLVQPLPNILFD